MFRRDFASRKPTVIKILFTASWCCIIKLILFSPVHIDFFFQGTYSMSLIWRGLEFSLQCFLLWYWNTLTSFLDVWSYCCDGMENVWEHFTEEFFLPLSCPHSYCPSEKKQSEIFPSSWVEVQLGWNCTVKEVELNFSFASFVQFNCFYSPESEGGRV